jgi:hypothetical protein
MTRPSVQISSENQLGSLRQHLDTMLPHFGSFQGVVGVTLNGGLSRGYADHLSEIDVTFYLTSEAFDSWRNSKAPIALGITMLDGQLYDIKHVSYIGELDRDWEDVALWDASYAEILYDPDGHLSKLFAQKLGDGPDFRVAEGLMMNCWWHFQLAGDIWIHRGDILQGHHMFNQSINPLVQALFVANREYIPHEKWLLHLSRSLDWKPADWESRLGAAMSTGDLTIESLRARQAVIGKLWGEIDRCIIEQFAPHLPVHVMQKSTYEHLKLLADAGRMILEEWQAQTGNDFPNWDPFYPIIRLEQGRIILDREALLEIGPDEMYSWHYDVLLAVKSQG